MNTQQLLENLRAERERINGAIGYIEYYLTLNEKSKKAKAILRAVKVKTKKIRRRKPMTAAQKKAVGIRMKAYWAKKRAEK